MPTLASTRTPPLLFHSPSSRGRHGEAAAQELLAARWAGAAAPPRPGAARPVESRLRLGHQAQVAQARPAHALGEAPAHTAGAAPERCEVMGSARPSSNRSNRAMAPIRSTVSWLATSL